MLAGETWMAKRLHQIIKDKIANGNQNVETHQSREVLSYRYDIQYHHSLFPSYCKIIYIHLL